MSSVGQGEERVCRLKPNGNNIWIKHAIKWKENHPQKRRREQKGVPE